MILRKICYVIILLFIGFQAYTQKQKFTYLDVFELEYVSDPQIAPDGARIAYRRMGFDIMKDKADGNLWIINSDGSGHQKLTSHEVSEQSPRWSPSGDRIAFISTTGEGSEIFMYWLDSGKLAKISQLPFSPSALAWSPNWHFL
jgi:dipeptidyl aminopeptidase/acylaminoacyl peptidase